ncbi:DUF6049 family protein [Blastococcus haudaquaticus]|uniref:Glycoprotein n=1 Tax=Blastococcus haudaquaticus TaxID=1938745 RepID=A0A286GK86_9ACTN|nr:DUF6049 family protein [Blastococcus haudaquaticus]SOD95509.1 hypothetical protein SAMN06272739_1235 [Blastococcus haudaquaticus]
MTRPALLRAAAGPLFATAIGLTALGVPATQASAAPPPVPASPLAAPVTDATEGDRPVRIEVGRFEPRTITPGSLVSVTGTLTNTGSSAITDLSVRLQRGEVITTRADLAFDQRDPDPATTVMSPFQPVDGELAAGAELDFSYTVPSETLRLTEDGVYPVLLNVNGAVDGAEQQRVGELSTYVVQQPAAPTARTAVAWLWPLVEPSHRTPSGGFRDDGLAEAVAGGGRLDRALAVIERLPGGATGDGTVVAPALQVTLAIDPALVEELRLMAQGPYEVDGRAGTGTDDAAAFLERLADVAAVHPVVALAYGDVDADAVVGAGIPAVLARSLPGTPAGTAQDPPGTTRSDDGAAAASTSGAPESPAPQPDAGPGDTGAGAAILSDALDVEPRTDLAWAAGGAVRADTLRVLQAGGVERVVLGADGLTDGEDATGHADPTAAARTTIATASGTVEALVADPTLGALVGAAEQVDGGARLAEQRYLAELAVLSLQAPEGTEQTVLVAPPRELDAGPEGAGAMMADTAGLPWLRPATVAELSAGTPVPAGDLAGPPEAPALDPTGVAGLVAAAASREDLAGAVVGDADLALRSYDAAISRAASATRRDDAEDFRAVSAALESALDDVLGRVTLLAPADGTYSLGSSDAPLVLTVRNDLPVTVEVLLDLRARGGSGLSIGDMGLQTLAPGERTTLTVPTEVRQAGGFAVRAQLTTPTGRPLGDEISLQVKSTAYGSISLIITIGAAVLLGLLFLRRLVNFVLRRRATAPGEPAGGPEGATLQPPNRSPV